METEVLIVGAGPTALSLACQLVRYGVDFAILYHKEGVTPFSKAIGVQARTLEIYDQLGIAEGSRGRRDPVTVRSGQSPNEPGALTLLVTVSNTPGPSFGSGGDDLYAPRIEEYLPLREQARSDTVAKRAGSKSVTIPADVEGARDEPPAVRYLREFQQQSRLTVLAYWPEGVKEPQKRLDQDLVKVPLDDALDILAKRYQCDWTEDTRIIRFRFKGKPPRDTGNS